MASEKPGGHGERCVVVGTLDMALWDAAAKITGVPLCRHLAGSRGALNKINHRNNQWREAERGLERGGRRVKGPTLPPSTRARARAREAIGNQRPWPADRVERWAIERLIPYAKNARTHTDAQIAAIAASIKEWGWTSPALVGEAWRPNRGPRQGARCPAAGHRRDPGDGRGGLERGAKGKSPISSRARRVSPATLSSSRPSRSAAVSAA